MTKMGGVFRKMSRWAALGFCGVMILAAAPQAGGRALQAKRFANGQAQALGSAAGAAAQQLRRAPNQARKPRAAGVGPRFVERLMRMSPDQRRRFLRQNQGFRELPPEERRRLQRRIQQLSRMTPERREQVLERYRLFHELPPEKQTRARGVYRRWRQFTPERRAALLDEFDELREASPEDRERRFDSKEFADSYSQQERQVLQELVDLLPSPGP